MRARGERSNGRSPVVGLRLDRRIAPFWRELTAIGVCLLVQTAYWITTPLVLSYLIDKGLIEKDRSVLGKVIVILALITIAGQIAGVLFDWLSANVLAELLRRLREDMFEHLQQLSIGYYAKTSEDDIVARFSTDAATVEEVAGAFVPWVVMPGLAVLGSTAALFRLDWRLALLAMLVWPSSLIGPRLSANRALHASVAKRESEAAALSQVQENVSAQSIVKSFVLRDHSISNFGDYNMRLSGFTTRMHFLSSLVERSSNIGTSTLQIAVLGWSAWMAFNGDLTIGQVTAFQTLFLLLGSNVDYVMQYVPTLIRSAGGLRRIDSLLKASSDVPDRPDAQTSATFANTLALDHVTFSYDGSRNNLDDVSLAIRKGSYVAFIGPSGCGKSTVLSLLMRLYDPQQGALRVDGKDIRDIRQDSYRSLMAPVLQESFLFNTTIRENIRMGKRDATDAQIEAAARAAEIDDAIRQMPNGYETQVGFRGGRLSGGQRQRLAIARAILRDPDVLVLDEATSALDAATESAINDTLVRLSRDRTVLSVTHRLASVADYDHIFVLDEGRLVEQGSHADLLQLGGLYAGLWNKQSGFRVSQSGDHAEVTPERLRAIPVFSKLDGILLRDLADDFVTERVPAHRAVVQQGDPADKFYVIARGKVGVTRRTDDGRDMEPSVLQDGDYFGEMGLLHNVPRLATVTTAGEAVFLTLTRDRFLRLLERAPELGEMLKREYRDVVDEPTLPSQHAGPGDGT